MDADAVIDDLLNDGVLAVEAGTERVDVVDEFEETIATTRSALGENADELVERFASFGFDESVARGLIEAAPDPARLVAVYVVLTETIPGVGRDERLLVAGQLVQLLEGRPPTDGAPTAFFPVDPDKVELFTAMYRRSIVYVWREDCEPCETVRADLDSIFEELPRDVGLLAVYGPDGADLLRDRYQVVGGPTLLFMHGTDVETRLLRVPPRSVIEAEVETLRGE